MSRMGEELEKRLDTAKYDMYQVLKELLDKYYMNRDSGGEFIACITPEKIPYYWQKARMVIEYIEAVEK